MILSSSFGTGLFQGSQRAQAVTRKALWLQTLSTTIRWNYQYSDITYTLCTSVVSNHTIWELYQVGMSKKVQMSHNPQGLENTLKVLGYCSHLIVYVDIIAPCGLFPTVMMEVTGSYLPSYRLQVQDLSPTSSVVHPDIESIFLWHCYLQKWVKV